MSDSDIQKAGDHSEAEQPNTDIFVFASTPYGYHHTGSAREAFDDHGAMWGLGEGASGGSYAIPVTGDAGRDSAAVGRFLVTAANNPEQTFVVSEDASLVAPAARWAERTLNVIMPDDFEDAEAGE